MKDLMRPKLAGIDWRLALDLPFRPCLQVTLSLCTAR